MGRLNIRTLRWLASIGLAIVLLVDLILSWRVRAGMGLGIVTLLVMIGAVGLTAIVLAPKATGTLFRHKDLLVLLALVAVAGKLVTWLSALPFPGALLSPSFSLSLFNLSLGLSLSVLLHIALTVAYATWMTAALLDLVRNGNGNPCRVPSATPKLFWRVLGVECIGWAVVMVATSFLLLLMPVMMFFALIPLALFGVAWNFTTAAVLPLAMEHEGGFWQSFRAGVAASLSHLGKWWFLLLAQMLLLGLVFYYRSSNAGHTNVSWSVNVSWTGGYEDTCRWYGKLADALNKPKLPFFETLLTLIFGAFAVVIKLAIVQRLQPRSPAASPIAPAGMSADGAEQNA
jgi:hypothetical protein